MSVRLSPAAPSGAAPTVARDRLDALAISVLTVLCAIWGTQQVLVKIAIAGGMPPALQAALRSVLAASFLVSWVGISGGLSALRRLFAIDRSLRPGLVCAVVFSAEFLLLYYGLGYTTASRAVLFLYTAPFFVAIGVHVLVPEERMTLRQVLGLLCAFAGMVVAVFDGLRGQGATLLGDAMVTGTAVLWATVTLMAKASPGLRSVTAAKVLLYQLAGSAPIMFVFAAGAGELPSLLHASGAALAVVLFQGFAVAFISYLIWYWMITHYPASKVAAFSFLTPLFGLMAGSLILAEPVSRALVMALALVAIGLFLINGATRKRALAA